MGYRLGIDLGTTYSAAAVQRPGTAPEMVALSAHRTDLPSVLFVAAGGEVLVGEAAERRAVTDPDRVVREFKRRVGDPTPVVVGGRAWRAEDLCAELVRWIVDTVATQEGGPAERIAVTHPASWGPHKMHRMAEALDARGLVVTFLAEPQAAALHYAATERVPAGSTIAVHDLGGGTFDAAVVRKTAADHFALQGRPEGIDRLGGVDFDQVVFDHVVEGVPEAFEGLDDAEPAARAAVARLRRECTEAKEALSADTEVVIPVLLPGFRGSVRLHRSEFSDAIRDRVVETVEALRRAVASAALDPSALDAVLLVGGSSRVPLVAQLVSEELGRPVAVDTDPKNAIAKGAVLAVSDELVTVPSGAFVAVGAATEPVGMSGPGRLLGGAAVGAAGLGVAGLGAAGLGGFELGTAAPGAVGPGAVGPSTAESGTAELGRAELGRAELGRAELGRAELGRARFGGPGSGSSGSGSAGLGSGGLGSVEPGSAGLGAAGLGAAGSDGASLETGPVDAPLGAPAGPPPRPEVTSGLVQDAPEWEYDRTPEERRRPSAPLFVGIGGAIAAVAVGLLAIFWPSAAPAVTTGAGGTVVPAPAAEAVPATSSTPAAPVPAPDPTAAVVAEQPAGSGDGSVAAPPAQPGLVTTVGRAPTAGAPVGGGAPAISPGAGAFPAGNPPAGPPAGGSTGTGTPGGTSTPPGGSTGTTDTPPAGGGTTTPPAGGGTGTTTPPSGSGSTTATDGAPAGTGGTGGGATGTTPPPATQTPPATTTP